MRCRRASRDLLRILTSPIQLAALHTCCSGISLVLAIMSIKTTCHDLNKLIFFSNAGPIYVHITFISYHPCAGPTIKDDTCSSGSNIDPWSLDLVQNLFTKNTRSSPGRNSTDCSPKNAPIIHKQNLWFTA